MDEIPEIVDDFAESSGLKALLARFGQDKMLMIIGMSVGILVLGIVLFIATAFGDNNQQVYWYQGNLSSTPSGYVSPQCDDNGEGPYEVVGPVAVSESGNYTYEDLSIDYALDMQLDVYENSFDVSNPESTYDTGVDDDDEVWLGTGTEYYFVVSPYCGGFDVGDWEFTLSGPGELLGGALLEASLLSEMEGRLNGREPRFNSPSCPDSDLNYTVLDPVSVSRSGSYHYRDISNSGQGIDMQVDIYEYSFNPSNPSQNHLIRVDDEGDVELDAGGDYVFVISPWCEAARRGRWTFSLIGPGVVTAFESSTGSSQPESGGYVDEPSSSSSSGGLPWHLMAAIVFSILAMLGAAGYYAVKSLVSKQEAGGRDDRYDG